MYADDNYRKEKRTKRLIDKKRRKIDGEQRYGSKRRADKPFHNEYEAEQYEKDLQR